MENLVTKEQAIKEFTKWLDSRKVTPLKRKEHEKDEKFVIEAIQLGVIEIDDQGKLSQNLDAEVNGKTKIEYAERLLVRDARIALKVVDDSDDLGKMIAIASKITDEKSQKVWDQYSFSDVSLASKLASYFL